MSRPPHSLIGAADRCCPEGLCAYRPGMITLYLSIIHDAPNWGDDPGEAADAALSSKGEGGSGSAPGGSGLCHNSVRIWDVQQAVKSLGRGATAVQIARKLCPWALDDAASDDA